MIVFTRLFIGLIGVMSLYGAFQHIVTMDDIVRIRELAETGPVGRANIRADIGGIFIGIGLFSLIAAIKQSRIWLTAAIILTSSAIFGRFATIAIDGYQPAMFSPILVEAIVIMAMLVSLQFWKKKSGGL